MDPDELPGWLRAQSRDYEEERVASGESPEQAAAAAAQSLATLFPDGRPAPGQAVYDVREDGTTVGSLWIGRAPADARTDWWVYSIELAAEHRGRGLGRQVMLLAEDAARAAGAGSLGLNVFGHNAVARHLYESLGYGTDAVQMSKDL
jgi:ribosomal protein S18 acetylase RimI-like enzyme